MDPADILVIGAGPAGLAASACLRAEGLPHVVVEREHHIAASWRRHYDRLHLHTTKTWSALPMAPWPRTAPRYPSRDEVVAYLEDYAATHRIAPRLGVQVKRVEQVRRQGDRFAVTTSHGDMAPRTVVVATGYNAVPRQPAIPGSERFRGTVMHASRYRNAEPFQGQRALVVGCGNSGAEIALDLAEHGVPVAMVVRGPVHVVPRDLFGRPTQHTNVWLSRLPLALRDALALATVGLAVGDLSPWGIVRPAMGPNRMIETTGRIPMLDIGTIDMVKRGRIQVRPGVAAIEADAVRFADGAVQAFDAIIFATGYEPGLAALVEGFEAVADARGRPDRFGEASALGALHFIGFRNPPTGALREIALEAPRMARAVAASMRAHARTARAP